MQIATVEPPDFIPHPLPLLSSALMEIVPTRLRSIGSIVSMTQFDNDQKHFQDKWAICDSEMSTSLWAGAYKPGLQRSNLDLCSFQTTKLFDAPT